MMRHWKSLVFSVVFCAGFGILLWHEYVFPPVRTILCEGSPTYHRPIGMYVPGYIRPAKDRQVVVFINGIRDDGVDAWTNSNGQYWPSLLGSEAHGWDVFVAQYPGSISIDEIGVFLKTDLDPVFSSHERVYVVAHSMGGLAIREYLIKNPTSAVKVAGMFFLSTPSLGSRLANLTSRLGIGNKQSNDLRTFDVNTFLQQQSRAWKRQGPAFSTNCAYEIRRSWFFEVVDRASAQGLCSGEARPMDESHGSIAKPECSGSYQERMLMSYLTELPRLPPDEVEATYEFHGPLEVSRRDNSVIFSLTPAVGAPLMANKRIRLKSLAFTAQIAEESDEPFWFDVELVPASDEIEVTPHGTDLTQMEVDRRYADKHSLIHFSTKTDESRAVHSAAPLAVIVPIHRRRSDDLSVFAVNDSAFKVGPDGLKLHLFLWTLWGGQHEHAVKFGDVKIVMRADIIREL